MDWRRVVRVLLEPAKDPLLDSFGVSTGRVKALRLRLSEQLGDLRSRTGRLQDPSFRACMTDLEAEHARLLEVEQRVGNELDTHRARRDLLNAGLTAAEAQDRLLDLVAALDDANARATALVETAQEMRV